MSGWWSVVGPVVVIVFVLGCCAFSLSLSKGIWSWLRFGSLDVFRCLPLVSSFVVLEACLGCSAGCNLFYIFLIFSLLIKYLSMHILKKGS
jgi:hypothetical protein